VNRYRKNPNRAGQTGGEKWNSSRKKKGRKTKLLDLEEKEGGHRKGGSKARGNSLECGFQGPPAKANLKLQRVL